MSEYDVYGKKTQVGNTVVFTDPWHGKHEATITTLEPKNGLHHVTLKLEEKELKQLIGDGQSHEEKWFQDRFLNEFRDVPHHKEGVPYSWDHTS